MRGGSNRLLTPAQTAEFLAVSLHTLYGNWRAWGLTGYRVGKHLRFRERDLESWLSRHVVNKHV
ncbi:helix-turn-helix domain-containing protein [Streptomyces sp. YKOK-I1]